MNSIYLKNMHNAKSKEEYIFWRNKIVEENIPLVEKMYKELFSMKMLHTYTIQDIKQEAYIALIECVENWDDNKGNLGTLLKYYIFGKVKRELDKCDAIIYVPSTQKHRYYEYRKCKSDKYISLEEYCNSNGYNYKWMVEVAHAIQPILYLSDDRRSEDESADIEYFLSNDDKTVENQYCEKELSYELQKILNGDKFTEKERYILYSHIGNGKLMKTIARELHISTSRVHQIENKALRKIRSRYYSQLMPYLN